MESIPDLRDPYPLLEMPRGWAMETVNERFVKAPASAMFDMVRNVEQWPTHLSHYRWVRFHERSSDGGGLVEMAAWRLFGAIKWPTWWLSEMAVHSTTPAIRFRHVRGITAGMEVEWLFIPQSGGTFVQIRHVWNGPAWPLISVFAATAVIGPSFVHAIAERTLHGLARLAEASPDASLPGHSAL